MPEIFTMRSVFNVGHGDELTQQERDELEFLPDLFLAYVRYRARLDTKPELHRTYIELVLDDDGSGKIIGTTPAHDSFYDRDTVDTLISFNSFSEGFIKIVDATPKEQTT